MHTIAITQGDPAGIGPEIVAKAFRDAPELLRHCFVVGDVATLRRAAQAIARPGVGGLPVAQISAPHEALAMPPRCVPVLPVPGIPGPQPWGLVSAAAGRAAADAVVWAARAALRGEVADFADDFGDGPAAFASARVGHDAERAAHVAALHDGDKGGGPFGAAEVGKADQHESPDDRRIAGGIGKRQRGSERVPDQRQGALPGQARMQRGDVPPAA